jgi:hypothetical protein
LIRVRRRFRPANFFVDFSAVDRDFGGSGDTELHPSSRDFDDRDADIVPDDDGFLRFSAEYEHWIPP